MIAEACNQEGLVKGGVEPRGDQLLMYCIRSDTTNEAESSVHGNCRSADGPHGPCRLTVKKNEKEEVEGGKFSIEKEYLLLSANDSKEYPTLPLFELHWGQERRRIRLK